MEQIVYISLYAPISILLKPFLSVPSAVGKKAESPQSYLQSAHASLKLHISYVKMFKKPLYLT